MATPTEPTAPAVGLLDQAPSEWTADTSSDNPFRKAAYATPQGAVVSAFAFPTAGVVDELLAVTNRFRGTVSLEPLTEDQLDDVTRPIDVLDRAGRLIECVGQTEALLAAVVETPGVVWFLKLSGPGEAVAIELAGFHQWLASLSLTTDPEEDSP